MQTNINADDQSNNVSNEYNLIDMPSVITLPSYTLTEASEVLKRLTTLMASV